MENIRVGIVGASGYSGAVMARLIASHPVFRLAFCTSDKKAGESVAQSLGVAVDESLTYEANGSALSLGNRADVVVLATSAEVSIHLAPEFLKQGKTVVDLSGGFRLREPSAYPRWYGFEHKASEWLSRAHYGLPEIAGPPPKGTNLVANPGCYPTASILALAPLVRAGLVESSGVIVDAKSGVTGAGRQAKDEYSFAEVDEDLRAYKVLSHQHTPEITQALSTFAPTELTFTAHLLPVRRGLMATCYARPKVGITTAQVDACLRDAYADSAFVRVVKPQEVSLTKVTGTNLAYVGAAADAGVVISIGVIDNLVKGAAGQALQNLNLLFGLEETTGLMHLQRIAP